MTETATKTALDEASRLRAEGRHEDAVAVLGAVLATRPDLVEGWSALAASHYRLKRFTQAARAADRALALAPDFVEIAMLLGNCRIAQGDIVGALDIFAKAYARAPESESAASAYLFYAPFGPRFDPAAHARANIAWGRRVEGAVPPYAHSRRVRRARLRVGYLSYDFGSNVTSYFFDPVLRRHDHGQVEIFLYGAEDATADHCRPIGGRDPRALAELIRGDDLDILTLASSYRARHRHVLAYKPAPIQVCYNNLVSTSGLARVDYLIAEELTDPSGSADELYAEKLVRLSARNVWSPPADCPQLAARAPGPVTFASFNNIAKVTRDTAKLWARILNALPTARLLIKTSEHFADAADWQPFRRLLGEAGVPMERVKLSDAVPTRAQHLAVYNEVDIALDTFPFNGGVTSNDALWMGVPVVSLRGPSFVSRQTASFLTKLGLDDLIADTAEDYVRIALELASDDGRRTELRQRLRGLMAVRVLDYGRHVRELERAYRTMHERFCDGLPPVAFSVTE